MASNDAAIVDQLQKVLYQDSAVAGEAAGLAMGMVLLGSSNNAAVSEMVNLEWKEGGEKKKFCSMNFSFFFSQRHQLQYARETQHEKIIRGIAVGLALVMYQTEEAAETLIDQLAGDKVNDRKRKKW